LFETTSHLLVCHDHERGSLRDPETLGEIRTFGRVDPVDQERFVVATPLQYLCQIALDPARFAVTGRVKEQEPRLRARSRRDALYGQEATPEYASSNGTTGRGQGLSSNAYALLRYSENGELPAAVTALCAVATT
jgi:hypothetical protein